MALIDRRAVLQGGLAAPALLLGAGRALAIGGDDPFTLGVASGEPWPDGFVIWTRLAPRPLEPHGGMPPHAVPVRWEVSADEQFRSVLRSGQTLAEPGWGHSVHVELSGLQPDRRYWYRFVAQGVASPIGRGRTAPARHAAVDRLRLIFGSCQKYEVGYYAAWRHAVAEDPDLILFLGDYIYENAPTSTGVRKYLNPEPFDLEGYRVRYATHKLDPLLQAAHAAAPWVLTWDDHEVSNDYGADWDQYGDPRTDTLPRRAAAYQAYWEHMPLRRTARPVGASAHLYRTLDWGALAQFQIVDDRQHRSAHPCQPPALAAHRRHYEEVVVDCAERDDPARTILGRPQEAWLGRALQTTRAKWNILAQQTLMTDALWPNDKGQPPGYALDNWGGYPAARNRVLRAWRNGRTPNPIVLSGDIHSFTASDMADPDAPERLLASEFVGGSITSLFPGTAFQDILHKTPAFHYAETQVRGYGVADVTAKDCAVRFRGLANARDENSAIATIASFRVEDGRRGMAMM